MSGFKKETPGGPPDPSAVYHLKCHGGLGDALWVLKKLANADKPVFIDVASEGRHRPRRVGHMLDHLPYVAGWRYSDAAFTPSGEDWPDKADPACLLGKTWAQVAPEPGRVLRVECNRWLESGNRIENWLPDLATTHRLRFDDPGPAHVRTQPGYVVFHLAGWLDVNDQQWVESMAHFKGVASVYVVGGSYDGRPAQVAARANASGVTAHLMTDLPWPDLYAVVSGASYLVGHPSGLTALADTLGVPGVVTPFKAHPRMPGTWNDPKGDQYHARNMDEFQVAVWTISKSVRTPGGKKWRPPAVIATPPGPGETVPDIDVVAAVVKSTPPAFLACSSAPGLARAALKAAYDAGRPPEVVAVVGRDAEAALAGCREESGRTTRKPLVAAYPDWAAVPSYATFDVVVCHLPGATPDDVVRDYKSARRLSSAKGVVIYKGPPVDDAQPIFRSDGWFWRVN